jgi:hypothetical protein
MSLIRTLREPFRRMPWPGSREGASLGGLHGSWYDITSLLRTSQHFCYRCHYDNKSVSYKEVGTHRTHLFTSHVLGVSSRLLRKKAN